MSKHETHMTRWYWEQVGGTLVEEFPAVLKGPSWSHRLLDGLIIKNGARNIAKPSEVSISGQDIIIIQTKNSRLGMYLIGQTLFSIELMRPHNPNSIESVALCSKTDTILEPFLLKHAGCKVVICPKEICQLTRPRTPPAAGRA